MAVLVLNASYEPLHYVSLEHAVKMLCRGVAVVEKSVKDEEFGPFPMPLVLRLVRYVKATWQYRKSPRWSKKAVHQRDRYKCVYCGHPATTIDHVVPKVCGGESTWENTVSSCKRCNTRKGQKTLLESGLRLTITPAVPSHAWISRYRGQTIAPELLDELLA